MGGVPGVVKVEEVPGSVGALTTLGEADHVDLFTAEAPAATDASPEEWARAILERAPAARRNAHRLWRLLGLRLGPPGSPDHVQGWRIADRGDGWVRLETGSWYLTAQALCLVAEGRVSLSLAVRHDRRLARLVWAVVAGPHERAVPVMLHQAVELMTP
ncbi:MAG TPA: hypothetical protein VIL48_15035 [Acidimicrobiales bacterium]